MEGDDAMTGTGATGSIQSVLGALRLLESIGTLQPVGVSRLARETGLPKTTVQRAVRTLDAAGWVRTVDGDVTRWELTSRMLGISLRAFGEYALSDLADPAMRELARRTGETIHLVALDGDEGIVVHRLDSSQAVRAYVGVGTRSPLHATASGQAIMAFLPEERARAVASGVLARFTGETLTDPHAVVARLAGVRERGYAVNVGEWRPEVASVSSPLLAADGTAVAALTVSVPLSRWSDALAGTYGGWIRELTGGLGPVPLTRDFAVT